MLLCAWMCGCGDDGYEDSTYLRVETSNITTVTNVQTNYSVGDILYFETNIPFLLTSASGKPIDLEEIQLEASQIGSVISLYKLNDVGGFEPVLLTSNQLVGDAGVYEEFVTFFYEKTSSGFTNRMGIKLDTAGTYEVRSSNLAKMPIFYQLDASITDTRIDLTSFLKQSSPDRDFTFTVE
ncbi:hypothetical protein [Nonlabens marinus]|uniref:Uncharacterized protein n=1 Tax=Nonlabens marinus S1-08 TaxID=1454201 RepID=W8VUJ3_9FLAO|nr:hypothetical protein [Nonlabens marinus]BAO54648.1 hypothetical protein NMS_0639 [Nonlabens marinus S1-08]